jgi:hypothetical protein
MASAAERFSRLEKLAVFLIALGEERTKEILADVDTDSLQHLNRAIAGLGQVTAAEKAAVMLEFAHFFYADEPISGPGATLPKAPVPPAGKIRRPRNRTAEPGSDAGKAGKLDSTSKKPDLSQEQQAILHTLEKVRRKVDPGQIDWGKAGYDFGDGFKGTEGGRG